MVNADCWLQPVVILYGIEQQMVIGWWLFGILLMALMSLLWELPFACVMAWAGCGRPVVCNHTTISQWPRHVTYMPPYSACNPCFCSSLTMLLQNVFTLYSTDSTCIEIVMSDYADRKFIRQIPPSYCIVTPATAVAHINLAIFYKFILLVMLTMLKEWFWNLTINTIKHVKV